MYDGTSFFADTLASGAEPSALPGICRERTCDHIDWLGGCKEAAFVMRTMLCTERTKVVNFWNQHTYLCTETTWARFDGIFLGESGAYTHFSAIPRLLAVHLPIRQQACDMCLQLSNPRPGSWQDPHSPASLRRGSDKKANIPWNKSTWNAGSSLAERMLQCPSPFEYPEQEGRASVLNDLGCCHVGINETDRVSATQLYLGSRMSVGSAAARIFGVFHPSKVSFVRIICSMSKAGLGSANADLLGFRFFKENGKMYQPG